MCWKRAHEELLSSGNALCATEVALKVFRLWKWLWHSNRRSPYPKRCFERLFDLIFPSWLLYSADSRIRAAD